MRERDESVAGLPRPCYGQAMDKRTASKPADGRYLVREAASGRLIEVKGAGALKGAALPLRRGLDLTKPISRQVMRRDTPATGGKA